LNLTEAGFIPASLYLTECYPEPVVFCSGGLNIMNPSGWHQFRSKPPHTYNADDSLPQCGGLPSGESTLELF